MSAPVVVWSLKIHARQEDMNAFMGFLPEGEVGQSCFKVDVDDRSDDALWLLDTLYPEPPDTAALTAALCVWEASRKGGPVTWRLETLPVKGWLKANQDSFAPIYAGRYVIHGRKERGQIPLHHLRMEMESSAAFGTGEHPTTHGSLQMLQRLPRLRRHQHVLDLGTGTGILAMGAALRGRPSVVAGDLDAESVAVAIHNVQHNGTRAVIRVVQSDGFRHRQIRKKKPYDLILSNIFARPLARFAPAMRAHLKTGGQVILAGFLHKDVPMVLRAYERQRIHLVRRMIYGHWSILLLQRPLRK